MRFTRRKKDANHDWVLKTWREFGWIVIDTSAVGSNAVPGFPDLVCRGVDDAIEQARAWRA